MTGGRRLLSMFCLALVGVAAVFAAAASPAASWSNTGPAWTKAKARSALLGTQRIQAVDAVAVAFHQRYLFEVGSIKSMRAAGPTVGGAKWRRFEVVATIRLLDPLPSIGGDEPRDPRVASFCLQVKGMSYRLTGFDTIAAAFGGVAQGCKDTPKARSWTGAPYR